MFKSLSLKTKISLMVGALSLAYLGVGFWLERNMGLKWQNVELRNIEAINSRISHSIGAQFFERYGDVQAFATNGKLLSANAQERVEALNAYISLYGIYDMILIVDRNGNLVSASNVEPSGNKLDTSKLYERNYADAPWFKEVMAGRFSEDKTKGFVNTFVEDAMVDEITSTVYGKKMYGNSFSAQLKSPSGKVIGVVTARAGFRWVEQDLVAIYDSLRKNGITEAEVLLLNKTGQTIVRIDHKLYDGTKAYERDWDSILKKPFANYDETVNRAVVNGERMITTAVNVADDNQENIVTFSGISDPKFVDSLGWRFVFSTTTHDVMAEEWAAEREFLIVFFSLGFIAIVFSYLFSRSLGSRLIGLANGINEGANNVTGSAKNVAEVASGLAASTQEQAAAVQETVSAIDEVSAMVAKSADNAKASLKVSEASTTSAERGRQTVTQMVTSINEIEASNVKISAAVEASNQKITSIVNLINEIDQKTKVINDIVFQTKLLSFNASVEAARAGEHGKGFAVVAEEIGNLAQMSGNAAKEIGQMLESSTKQVESIASETKSKISGLMTENQEKIRVGVTNANTCADVLSEILEKIRSVADMSNEIATASNEQASGVGEITKAMNQLDSTAQSNATGSQQSSAAAAELLNQADSVRGLVRALLKEVAGTSEVETGATESSGPVTKRPSNKNDDSSGSKKIAIKERLKNVVPLPVGRKDRAREREIKVVGGEAIPSQDDPRFEEI